MTKRPEKDAIEDDDLDGERRRRRRRGAMRVPSDNVPRRPTEPRMEALDHEGDLTTPVPEDPTLAVTIAHNFGFGGGGFDQDDRATTAPIEGSADGEDERPGPGVMSAPVRAVSVATMSDSRQLPTAAPLATAAPLVIPPLMIDDDEGEDWDAEVSGLQLLQDDDSEVVPRDVRTREMPAAQLEALGLASISDAIPDAIPEALPTATNDKAHPPAPTREPAPVRERESARAGSRPRAQTMALSEDDIEELREIEAAARPGAAGLRLPPPSASVQATTVSPPTVRPLAPASTVASAPDPAALTARPVVRFSRTDSVPAVSEVATSADAHASSHSARVRVVFSSAGAIPAPASSPPPARASSVIDALEIDVEPTAVNAIPPQPVTALPALPTPRMPNLANLPSLPTPRTPTSPPAGQAPSASPAASTPSAPSPMAIAAPTAAASTAVAPAAVARSARAASVPSVPSVTDDDDDDNDDAMLEADIEGEVASPSEASDSGEILTEDLIEEVEAQAAQPVAMPRRAPTADLAPTATAPSASASIALASPPTPVVAAPSSPLTATVAPAPSAAATSPAAHQAPPRPPPKPASDSHLKDNHTPPPPPAKVKQSAAREAAVAAVAAPQVKKKRKSKPWFEEIFDEDYLRTLPFLTPRATQQEAAFVTSALDVPAGSHILDLGCGYGRHAMELAQRGYHVVALDLSLPLLLRGADEAQRRGLTINFVHGDMRELSFESQFDGAYCVFSTFGYFDDETNKKTAVNLCRALKPGGRVVLEILNRDYLIADLPARVWWEGDGCVVLEEVDFNYFSSRVVSNRSVVFDDGRQLEHEISMRAYSLHEFGKLLHAAGFRVLEISGSLATRGRFFGAQSREIIVVAEKRATSKDGETTVGGSGLARDGKDR